MTPKSENDIHKYLSLSDKEPFELFIDSCENGYMIGVLYALKMDIDNKINDRVINWGLRRSIYGGDINIVKYLIEEKGADIHDTNEWVFRNACELRYIDIIKYAIDKGANIYVNGSEYLRWRLDKIKDKNILEILREQDKKNKKNKLHESIRDKMKPKSKSEIDNIIKDWTPRELFISTKGDDFIKKKAMEYMIPFEDVEIGDYLTIAVRSSMFYNQPLVKIKEKYTFNNEEEFKNYLREHRTVIVDSGELVAMFKNKPNVKKNAVVVNYISDIIFYYGGTNGVFPYTDEEIEKNKNIKLDRTSEMNIKLHSDYLNEGIRDMMKPRSEENIKKSLKTASPERKLSLGISYNFDWLIQQAIDEGVDLKDPVNSKYLIHLCVKGNIDKVKIFIDAGVDVHVSGDACLQRAVDSKNVELVKMLLNANADVHANMDYAIRWSCINNNFELSKLLLEAGANSKIAKNFPMKMAEKHGNIKLIELLKKYMKK